MLTVLLGGARSGKSTAALRLARGPDVCFVATSPRIDGDDDLAARIDAHRAERPATWTTVEAEIELADAIRSTSTGDMIVDCVTVWVGNLMHHGWSDDEITVQADAAIAAAAARSGDTVVVSNEVGLGIVPADAATRRYRDLLGRINQRWVAASDRALFMVAGRAIELGEAP